MAANVFATRCRSPRKTRQSGSQDARANRIDQIRIGDSSYTARDRDRLRQQQLENLGWRFHRIWSTDWFVRKEDEVKRTLQAFRDAVTYADNVDAGKIQNGKDTEDEAERSNGINAIPTTRGRRPPVPVRGSIDEYTMNELMQLVSRISSDGQLRTDAEMISEMISVLGFKRRGTKIEEMIKTAIELQAHSSSDGRQNL
jgi:hypothetical protein